jgi:hypothetical protein
VVREADSREPAWVRALRGATATALRITDDQRRSWTFEDAVLVGSLYDLRKAARPGDWNGTLVEVYRRVAMDPAAIEPALNGLVRDVRAGWRPSSD